MHYHQGMYYVEDDIACSSNLTPHHKNREPTGLHLILNLQARASFSVRSHFLQHSFRAEKNSTNDHAKLNGTGAAFLAFHLSLMCFKNEENTILSSYILKGREFFTVPATGQHTARTQSPNMDPVMCNVISDCAVSPSLNQWFITPETIIISPDRRQVSLLHFPFPSQASPKGKISTDYLAPEHIRGKSSPS